MHDQSWGKIYIYLKLYISVKDLKGEQNVLSKLGENIYLFKTTCMC